MYIIVVGGGKVGYYLARTLLGEGHEVLVIEKNATKCERANEELGSVCVRGDGCETSTMAEAGAQRADMVIAVTGDDEDNLVVCQVAKHRFNVPRTLARINNPKNETIFKKLGIDVTVSSTNLILEHIESEVPTHPLMHLLTLQRSGLEVVNVRIPEGGASAGKKLRDINLPPQSIVAAIISDETDVHIPSGDTVLRAGDEVLAVIKAEAESVLRAALAGM